MREFFELVNEYPWTTFFLLLGVCAVLGYIAEVIHGPNKTIIYKDKDDNKD